MTHYALQHRAVCRRRNGRMTGVEDTLVVEEPMEVRVHDQSFTVTMRTPGHDFELTRGLLLTEGMIRSERDIGSIAYCDTGTAADTDIPNIVTVHLAHPPAEGRQWQRQLMSGSSCGLCGKSALDSVQMQLESVLNTGYVREEILLQMPDLLRSRQSLFERTGGLHAVGIFTQDGECLCVYEDIGRHNATDKAIGCGVAEGWLPWRSETQALVLLVSGRASFEITQKALMANIPIVCAISAASSLAAELAAAQEQTLVGFLRDTGYTIYSGAERILS